MKAAHFSTYKAPNGPATTDAYPVCCGIYIVEELYAFRSGPETLHGEAGIKRWPRHSGCDEFPHLQGRPPLQASPGHRPPDLPVAYPPWHITHSHIITSSISENHVGSERCRCSLFNRLSAARAAVVECPCSTAGALAPRQRKTFRCCHAKVSLDIVMGEAAKPYLGQQPHPPGASSARRPAQTCAASPPRPSERSC